MGSSPFDNMCLLKSLMYIFAAGETASNPHFNMNNTDALITLTSRRYENKPLSTFTVMCLPTMHSEILFVKFTGRLLMCVWSSAVVPLTMVLHHPIAAIQDVFTRGNPEWRHMTITANGAYLRGLPSKALLLNHNGWQIPREKPK